MRSLIPLLFCLFASAPWAGEIYRYVDQHGQVVFSDERPEGATAESIELPAVNTMPAEPLYTPSSATEPASASATRYRSLRIGSPADDSTVRDNSGSLQVQAALEPPLAAGHQLVFFLDGREVGRGSQSQISLANIDRGSHQLQVAVVDAAGRELIRSPASRLHLKRQFQRSGG